MKNLYILLLVIASTNFVNHAQNGEFVKPAGPYLGENPPGIKPIIFAPGIISTDTSEGCSGWGIDQKYFIYQRWFERKSKLYIMNQNDSVWSNPELLTNFEKFNVGDFTIAPDGKTMVFVSNNLIEEIGTEEEGGNIWITQKENNNWTEPKPIGDPINTKYHDSYPCLAANGNLYFFSRKPGGYGQSDIYMSEYIAGKYQEPVNLGELFNTEYREWDPYIAPDESYLIFCSMKPGGLGEDDFYISFKQTDGSWGIPIHMGDEINSDKSENRPYVSPDGKYFFYTSSRKGNRDIYWVSTDLFKILKQNQSK